MAVAESSLDPKVRKMSVTFEQVRYHVNKYYRIDIFTGCGSSYGERLNILTRVYILTCYVWFNFYECSVSLIRPQGMEL